MASNQEILLEVKRNQIKMMQSRGYDVPEDELKLLDSSIPMDSVDIEELSRVYTSKLPQRGNTLVYYIFIFRERDIGKDEVIPFIRRLENEKNCTDAILITDRPLAQAPMEQLSGFTELAINALRATGTANTSSEQIENLPYFVQHFRYYELMYNPTEHFAVAPHMILGPEEFAEFAKKQVPSKLPSIKYRDAVAKYLGAKPGQIIRVRRTNITQSSIVKSYDSYSYVVR